MDLVKDAGLIEILVLARMVAPVKEGETEGVVELVARNKRGA